MVRANKSMLPGAAGSVKRQKLSAKFKAIALSKVNTKFNEVYNSLSSKEKSSMEKKGMNKLDLKEAYLTDTGVLGFKQFYRGQFNKGGQQSLQYNPSAKEFTDKLEPVLLQSINKFIRKFDPNF